jgi:hypothetical protein
MKSIIFWDMTLACWFFAELISSTLKMEAVCSSGTSVETQRTTQRHIPEDDTLQFSFVSKCTMMFFIFEET